MTDSPALRRRVRFWLILFVGALAASGLTAIPLEWEIGLMNQFLGPASAAAAFLPDLAGWIGRIHDGVQNGYGQYPFLAYGTDWLAFGHVAIAVAFIGPLRDPVKNLWVVEFGMIACLLTIPWTLIFGPLRQIPVFWMLIDMSFGVFGLIPLWLARSDILRFSRPT